MNKILIIDDDVYICDILTKLLQNNGFLVEYVFTALNAQKKLKTTTYDIVLCDFRLPDGDGLEILRKIKTLSPDTAVIIMTAYADIKMAVKLMKSGASDYVTKPLQSEEIVQIINQVLKKKSKEEGTSKEKFVFGESEAIREVLKMSEIIAPTDMTVLIEGETGSGKEYVARYIHTRSSRAKKPFIAVDCGAIPKDLANSELFGHIKGSFTGAIQDKKGVFEQANGGTLFLDEIGNLTYEIQIKLLRTLQERVITRLGDSKNIDVNVRIITATNEDISKQVSENNFREDLFHRVNEFKIKLPPLRERKQDIMIYAEHFMLLANTELNKSVVQFHPEVIRLLYQYPWYGNLRELNNVIRRSVLMAKSDTITPECFPEQIRFFSNEENPGDFGKDLSNSAENTTRLKDVAKNIEKQIILNTLIEVNYNKSKAAKILDIDRKTLYNKLKLFEIDYIKKQ